MKLNQNTSKQKKEMNEQYIYNNIIELKKSLKKCF